jgi:hypothetical protein
MYGLPRPVTGTALIYYMYMKFMPHRKHIYRPSRPVRRIAFIFILNSLKRR